jgi:hypothetical protein
MQKPAVASFCLRSLLEEKRMPKMIFERSCGTPNSSKTIPDDRTDDSSSPPFTTQFPFFIVPTEDPPGAGIRSENGLILYRNDVSTINYTIFARYKKQAVLYVHSSLQ